VHPTPNPHYTCHVITNVITHSLTCFGSSRVNCMLTSSRLSLHSSHSTAAVRESPAKSDPLLARYPRLQASKYAPSMCVAALVSGPSLPLPQSKVSLPLPCTLHCTRPPDGAGHISRDLPMCAYCPRSVSAAAGPPALHSCVCCGSRAAKSRYVLIRSVRDSSAALYASRHAAFPDRGAASSHTPATSGAGFEITPPRCRRRAAIDASAAPRECPST
jgi:hypothetical protein